MLGFETSSTTMTMALYELAYRHDIQKKLRDEIEEVCKRNDGNITYDSIKEMTYLDQVVNGNVFMKMCCFKFDFFMTLRFFLKRI